MKRPPDTPQTSSKGGWVSRQLQQYASVQSISEALHSGGGVFAYHSDVTLVNNAIVDNWAEDHGPGAYIKGQAGITPTLLHNTIARNIGGDGVGIYLRDAPGSGFATAIRNTILSSQATGIYVSDECLAIWDSNLIYDTTSEIKELFNGLVADAQALANP